MVSCRLLLYRVVFLLVFGIFALLCLGIVMLLKKHHGINNAKMAFLLHDDTFNPSSAYLGAFNDLLSS